MPVVKSKPKLKGKPGRSAGSVVAKGLATKSTKTAKKKSSPPSVDSGYSLYSTDSEDPVTAANRGLDRCAALLANILESDDSERIASKSRQTQKKTKTGTKLKEKTGTKKSSAGTSENKLKSQPKHHTFTVPTATQDVDVSLSESPSGSNRVPINLDTDSHPMLPFKPDTDIHSGSKEAPYNERLPSSTPISTPPTLIQTEKEKQQLRERLQQGNLPVNHSKSPQDQSSKFVSHPEQNFTQQYTNGYQTLESQILRDYQNQMPVNPVQPGLMDDTGANTGARNLYVNRWLQTDPRGHQPNAVVSSNGIYQPAAMESLLTTQPSLNQWHYHHNPNYGAILPEKEGTVNVSPNQYYPPTGGIPNYFQYGRDTDIPRTMPQQPLHYHFAGNENYTGMPGVNMNRYGNPEGMHHYGIRNEQLTVHPPSVNEGTAVHRPDVGRQTTEGAFGSGSQGSNDGSHRPSSATSTAWTTTTNPSSHVMQTVSGGPRSSSACGSQLTIDTSYQPDNDIAKPISPFRPSTSYTSSRSNSLVHNISISQSDAESKSHESKSSNEKAGANRTPVKTPPTHSENQSHKRKSNPVHTVKYLLRELRALNSMHGDIEVNRLLDEIDYTMNAVPDVKATYNMETEIGLALQPLRSENAQLRRKLRIVNQQLKDKEKVKTEPKEGTVSYDLLAAETMNATLQRQLDDDKKHRDKLLKRIEELKEKLQIVQDERKKMLYLMDEKDSDHLKSREEWTLELSKMKVQAEQATAKAETLQIKLEASIKEKDILQLTLKQRDAEIERLKDLNESLQLSVSNLVQDLETSKPSLSYRDDQYTVPPVSLHRLENLLNPDLISQRENNPWLTISKGKLKGQRSETSQMLTPKVKGQSSRTFQKQTSRERRIFVWMVSLQSKMMAVVTLMKEKVQHKDH
ncbi:uncharacterized protein [Ptychodera flava]|uniref:uncharacterized protein n=1 Tax=Ptychodera flava TaxID=63121 RepID=UPI00396A640A